METNAKTNPNSETLIERIDVYSILRDLLRNSWVILLGAIAIAMIVNIYVKTKNVNKYSSSATFVVTSKTSSNYVYSNLTAASTMAKSFSNILNSSLMKKKVCKDLGISSFDASMSASVIFPFQYSDFANLSSGASHARHFGHWHRATKSFSQQLTHGSKPQRMPSFFHHSFQSSTFCFQTPGSDTHIVTRSPDDAGRLTPPGSMLKYSGWVLPNRFHQLPKEWPEIVLRRRPTRWRTRNFDCSA